MDRSSARITKMKNKLEFDLSFCRPGEHEGVVNTMGWERSVQIRKEEIWKLSVSLRSSVFSRSADRSAKNREISIDLSLPFSLSLSFPFVSHATMKFPASRMLANVRIASDKWHFRYFCAIQSSDACQRGW